MVIIVKQKKDFAFKEVIRILNTKFSFNTIIVLKSISEFSNENS